MSIKVAIRVRPFTPREIKLRTDLCVSMSGNSCTLRSEDGKERSFAFDHCFWSHDGFREEKDGKFVSTSDKYADQNAVFDKVGKEILENAWAGYHCCLFAYGQTGSGKSYSIIGYGSNQGIVPRTAEEIFKRINQTKSPNKIYEVTTSMMEIYNEKIHDLLVAGSYQKEGGLKVRENKTLGVYVEDLSKWPVQSFADISSKIEEGNRNRTIASTALNSTSSRAHTIITIELRQVDKTTDKAVSRHSVIYLVDLAGSERVGKSDTKGDRLKETCSINKSLSALGKVISTLAERDSTKKSNVVIPYRDAVLTRILQNALGGNSKTLMICAISPAMENYDETLSTLRYADQAKKIKCNAVVNESETDKIIRLLKEENEKLRLQLLGTNSSGGANQVNKELEEQLQANQHLIDGLMKPFEQRIKEMKELINTDQVYDYSAPHLININEDMLLSGKIFFNLLAIPILYVGRKNSKPKPHVILNGPGIEAKHARIMNNDGRIFIVPQSPECKHIFVNGKM
jgi:kinesin family protein 13